MNLQANKESILMYTLNARYTQTKMINEDYVENLVKSIIIEQFGFEEVTNGASFENLGIDSLDKFELLIALEEEFDILIPDKDFDKITTVQQAIDYIRHGIHSSCFERKM